MTNDAIEALKKQAEKKFGMSWDKIMKQADEDTKKQKKDPIAHAHKQSSKSPNKMFKESMSELKKKSSKKS